MKQQILETIRTRGEGVTFVELMAIEGFKGDYVWGREDYNIWFWGGLSDQAIDALEELLRTNQIAMTPTYPLTYLIDGVIVKWPIAKQVRKYKKEHWLPVVFNLSSPKFGTIEHMTPADFEQFSRANTWGGAAD